jgi:hypothetical protein
MLKKASVSLMACLAHSFTSRLYQVFRHAICLARRDPYQEGIVAVPPCLRPRSTQEPIGLHDPLLADQRARPLQQRVQRGVLRADVHVPTVKGLEVATVSSLATFSFSFLRAGSLSQELRDGSLASRQPLADGLTDLLGASAVQERVDEGLGAVAACLCLP